MVKNTYNTPVIITAVRLSLFPAPPASKAQQKMVEEAAVQTVTRAFNAWFYNT
jgi:hypothetical protein